VKFDHKHCFWLYIQHLSQPGESWNIVCDAAASYPSCHTYEHTFIALSRSIGGVKILGDPGFVSCRQTLAWPFCYVLLAPGRSMSLSHVYHEFMQTLSIYMPFMRSFLKKKMLYCYSDNIFMHACMHENLVIVACILQPCMVERVETLMNSPRSSDQCKVTQVKSKYM
jgi:hypothetical protein